MVLICFFIIIEILFDILKKINIIDIEYFIVLKRLDVYYDWLRSFVFIFGNKILLVVLINLDGC